MSGPNFTFGGNPVQPGDSTYKAYITGFDWPNNTTLLLSWPFSFTSTGNPVRTTMTFLCADDPGTVQLPNATEAATGQAFIMWNIGIFNINVLDFAGQSLFTMGAGLTYYVVLADSSTPAGLWQYLLYGAATSGTNAETLAGYGLIALPNPPNPETLNVDFARVDYNANFTIDINNWAQLLVINTGCTDVTLPAVTTNNGYFFYIYNNNTVIVTLSCSNPSLFINGSSSIDLLPGSSCMVQFDGATKYTTVGLPLDTGAVTSLVTLTIPPDVSFYNVSSRDLNFEVIVLTSTSTMLGPVTIYFGAANNQWIVHNLINSSFPVLVQGGTNAVPLGDPYVLGNGLATSYYVNADQAAMYPVDLLPPVPPTTNGQFPISYNGAASWGGVAILQNIFVASSTPVPIGGSPVVLFAPLITAPAGTLTGFFVIQGVIQIGPEPTSNVAITIQRQIDGGSFEDLYYQGVPNVYSYSGFGADSATLIPVPVYIVDNITGSYTSVTYQISAIGTVVGSFMNVSNNASTTGVSYINVEWYGATFV